MKILDKLFKKKQSTQLPNTDRLGELAQRYRGDKGLLELLDILILERTKDNARIKDQKEYHFQSTKLNGIIQLREFLEEEDENIIDILKRGVEDGRSSTNY